MRTIEINKDLPTKVDLLVYQVIKLWTKLKKQMLDKFGLTSSQFEVLAAICYFANTKKETIQIDISEKTGIDPMTTSTILRNLEKKGLITRVRGTENTRIVIVEITKQGLDIYNKAFVNLRKVNQTLYNKIDKKNLSTQLLILSDELNKLNI